MKKLRVLITSALVIITIAVNAQSDVDALRYSMIGFGGTARYTSMGGAFGAIGADFSTLSANPAGLGVYRKNEFTFTPSIYTGKTTATYLGNTAEDMKYNFNFSNIGLVYAKPTNKAKDQTGWKSVNVAIGLNRYNNFNNRMIIEGTNTTSSLMDKYRDIANNNALDPFNTQLAFDTYLIDTINNNTYFSNVPIGNILQRKSIESKGAMQEMVFSLGANYNNKLYIGGTIGISFLKYWERSTYEEINNGDTISYFKNFALNEDLTTKGTGYNFKFGLIYVPVDFDMFKVKIGAAVHTPTFYSMHDEWSKTMESAFTNNNYTADSPQGNFDYNLTTPMRAIGSLAIQIGQYGTISADYEFVDYSEARLRSDTYKYFDENDKIDNTYTATNNLRFGAEAAIGLFSIRGGYAIYGSPYKSNINDGKRTSITGGIGILDKNYFVDLGYAYTTSNEDYYLYNYTDMTAASTKKISQTFLITLGLKF